ncbi:Uncharacterized protein FKW44_010703 [Caligus rogercresseyi]|uniref:Uncharacterized protein n=1 Tax=Caligus rogercresseyi TaxID=217165 RepID=A0A7T8K9R3_CALRO|nr:Uncharacterized protein FKW44_010703 [Caligus rogercresseyi]
MFLNVKRNKGRAGSQAAREDAFRKKIKIYLTWQPVMPLMPLTMRRIKPSSWPSGNVVAGERWAVWTYCWLGRKTCR